MIFRNSEHYYDPTAGKAIENPALQTLLEMRYLCYRDWPEICRAMYYSNTSVHRLHQRALKKVERILGGETK